MTCTETTFLHDVQEHQLTIIRDDGVSRHIRLKQPGTMCMHFDLITWPGYLCYTGDMGTYVFRRLNDMFQFFRTDANKAWLKSKGLTLGVNLSYWGEKLEALDRGDGYKAWSEEKFKSRLREVFDQWAADELVPSEIEAAWKTVDSDVIDEMNNGGKETAYRAAMDCEINGKHPFRDFYEIDTEDYSHRFVWCCYALAWGISKYDAAKIATATEGVAA
ncbi:MAG: hypothetical protein Q8R67_05260 [Rhodoferax sp.]|nr:hypothetical protein [Rhodoferax sp.]MDP3651075.1 hypothetical protein [Rhodoferax sp.]